MIPRTVLRSVVVLIALLTLGASAAVGAPTAPPSAEPSAQCAVSPVTGGMMPTGEFDLMFIDMMIVHHQGAVAMAEIAIERGEHPEVVDMAEEIIAAQEEEIAQLETWRDAWYPDAPRMSMEDMMGDMPGMGGMMDPAMAAEALRATPEPFDLAFIDAMIPHHLGALMMTEMAIQQATHPELASAAQAMFDMQIDEIQTMRTWRAEWYGVRATPAS